MKYFTLAWVNVQHNSDHSLIWFLHILSPMKNLQVHNIYSSRLCPDQIQSNNNYTLYTGKVGYSVGTYGNYWVITLFLTW